MPGENDKLVEGLGAGKMQLTGDFILRHEDGTELFKVDAETGDITSSGTFPGGAPSGAAGGDLSGTYPNPSVAKLDTTGTSVTVNTAAPPTTGQVLTATSATAANWQTPASGSPTGAAGGDLGGTYPNPSVDALNTTGASVNVALAGPPTTGQVLKATSATTATWQAESGGSPTGSAGGDLSGTYPNPSVAKVGTTGTSVTVNTASPPTTGQVLTATSATAANWQTPSGGGGTPGGADGNIQYNNGGSFGGESELFYDDTNNRLGVGTASPQVRTEVATGMLRIRDSGVDLPTSGEGLEISAEGGNAYIQSRSMPGNVRQTLSLLGSQIGIDGTGDVSLDSDADILLNAATGVGIGTASPSADLDLVGTFQYTDGNQANGFVLTSDASGNATWQSATGGVIEGTYTPASSGLTNLDSVTLYAGTRYTRISNTVFVQGRFEADPTTAGANTFFFMTLPVAPNFVSFTDGHGTCTSIDGDGAAMVADVGQQKLQVNWVPATSNSTTYSFVIMYLVQ